MAEYSGFAAKLQVNESGFTDIAQVRDINGPSISLDTTDASHRGSAWKVFVPALIDGGEVTLGIAYDPDLVTHSATAAPGLPYYLMQRLTKAYKVLFPDTSPASASFSAIVTKFTPKAPYAGLLTADVTLKITGAVTWA